MTKENKCTYLEHKDLHESLDTLAACWMDQTTGLPSQITLMEFLKWSHTYLKLLKEADKEPKQ